MLRNKILSGLLVSFMLVSSSSVFAIENTSAPAKKSAFSFFKKDKNEVKLRKEKKRVEVSEVELPEVFC